MTSLALAGGIETDKQNAFQYLTKPPKTDETMANSSMSDNSRASSNQPNFTAAEGVTGAAFQKPTNPDEPAPLTQLEPHPQKIDCPNCQLRTQTRVEGRSKGKTQFMNVFWWPLPGRRHWFEKTHWFCGNCNYELAVQKYGKDLEVSQISAQ